MKRQLSKIKVATVSALLFFFLATPLFAANLNDWEGELKNAQGQTGYSQTQNPEDIVGGIIKTALSLLGVIFIILIIYGGYLWMTAGGNEDKVSKAQTIIRNSVIGLAIVLAAYAITFFIVQQLTDTTGYAI